ncbi:MAG TPA: SDR family oxidoreductase [Aliidongia sp.]|nr:SDR family oxidoreductase [Aliidongia sp.]
MKIDLNGRHALVTGASQGLGADAAIGFARAGAQVTITARRSNALDSVITRLEGAGHGTIAADLLVPGEAARVAAEAERRAPVDIVVHAAGGNMDARDVFGPSEAWQRVWQLNVGAVIDLNNVLVPGMRARHWGRILHFSSRSTVSLGGAPAYAAAKTYLNAYTIILARAVAADGVVVSAVAPGAVVAPGNNWEKAERQWPENVAKYVAEHQAIGRLGRPGDITPFLIFLASDEARFAAGSIVPIDGGSM